MLGRAVTIIAVLSCAVSPVSAQTAPGCAPAADPICRTIASPEFAAAYRDAAAGGVDPADAVDEVRANLRHALLGAGQAGPAAIGRQVDAVLDDALAAAQRRMCGGGRAAPAVAVAGGLAAATAAQGAHLGNAMLGAMTGAVVGAAGRDPACLCVARGFDAIRQSCAAR